MNKTELRDAVAAAADLNGTQADKAQRNYYFC